MNFGRGDLNFFSYLINRLRGSYRYLTNFNFIKKSKMNVSHHYDISDDLYDLFLDPKRQYSCGYFRNENDSLETAQNNKIQHIIKKLNLKPNQKVLDIGCGWGSLAIDIAKNGHKISKVVSQAWHNSLNKINGNENSKKIFLKDFFKNNPLY